MMQDELAAEELGFYELEGLRENDSVFTVEVLGENTEGSAIVWARHYSSLWEAVVRLYRVPGLNLTSDPWPADARTFCRQVGRNQPLDPHVDIEAEYHAAIARLETMDAERAEQSGIDLTAIEDQMPPKMRARYVEPLDDQEVPF